MKTMIRLLTLAAVLPAAVVLNAAKINVSSEPADKMTDVRIAHTSDKESLSIVLDQIRKGLQRDANRFLAADQTLDIHFNDIDLAGDFEPWHRVPWDEIRWVRDFYIPRLKFDYKITNADGSVLAEGKENLVDPAFQMTGSMTLDRNETHYERQMLTDWLRQFRVKKNKS